MNENFYQQNLRQKSNKKVSHGQQFISIKDENYNFPRASAERDLDHRFKRNNNNLEVNN